MRTLIAITLADDLTYACTVVQLILHPCGKATVEEPNQVQPKSASDQIEVVRDRLSDSITITRNRPSIDAHLPKLAKRRIAIMRDDVHPYESILTSGQDLLVVSHLITYSPQLDV